MLNNLWVQEQLRRHNDYLAMLSRRPGASGLPLAQGLLHERAKFEAMAGEWDTRKAPERLDLTVIRDRFYMDQLDRQPR